MSATKAKGDDLSELLKRRKERALRRGLIKMLVATDDLFDCITVDKDGFADKERERLKRKQQRKEAVRRETARK